MNDKIYGAMNKKYGTINAETLSYSRDEVEWLIIKNRLLRADYEIVVV